MFILMLSALIAAVLVLTLAGALIYSTFIERPKEGTDGK